jgi:hypothetical protein
MRTLTLADGNYLFINFLYRPIEGLSKNQNLTEIFAQTPNQKMVRKPLDLLHKGAANTPEPIISYEDMLLDPDFDISKSCFSLRPKYLDYNFENDGSEVNDHYIPFDVSKDYEPLLALSEHEDSPKRQFPSFQMEDNDLEDKLYSPNGSFAL